LPDYLSDLACDEIGTVAQDRLRKSSSVVLWTVSCEHAQGVLFLRGQVPSDYCKQLAQQTVAGVPGVTQVVNQIEVAAACQLGCSATE
jgi:osmotically-inducible protein OsmY